jgi:hypothetical protein
MTRGVPGKKKITIKLSPGIAKVIGAMLREAAARHETAAGVYESDARLAKAAGQPAKAKVKEAQAKAIKETAAEIYRLGRDISLAEPGSTVDA